MLEIVGYLQSAIVHARNANLFKPVPFNTVFGDEKHCSKYKKAAHSKAPIMVCYAVLIWMKNILLAKSYDCLMIAQKWCNLAKLYTIPGSEGWPSDSNSDIIV